jgi:hypothetical protein
MTEIRDPRRLLSAAFSIIGAAAVVVVGLAIYERRSNPVYLIETYHVVLAVAAATVALASLAGMLVVHRYDLAALSALTSSLLVSGIAALPSIGVILILLAFIPVWFLARRLAHGLDWPAVLSGAGVGAGLLILTWVAIQPPLVACGDGGATININGRYDSVSGESTRLDGGEAGSARFDGHSLSYECQQSELVRFELTREAG